MRDRKQPAVKFPPRRIAADALHHCDKNILRQVISVLLMPGQFENISVNSRIPAADQKLQCALISAFDPAHQFVVAIFHCLTAFSVSVTQKHPQKDEPRRINLKTPQSKRTPGSPAHQAFRGDFLLFPLGGEKLHPVVPTFISCYILYIFHPVFSDFLCGKWILSSYQHHAFKTRLLAGFSFSP